MILGEIARSSQSSVRGYTIPRKSYRQLQGTDVLPIPCERLPQAHHSALGLFAGRHMSPGMDLGPRNSQQVRRVGPEGCGEDRKNRKGFPGTDGIGSEGDRMRRWRSVGKEVARGTHPGQTAGTYDPGARDLTRTGRAVAECSRYQATGSGGLYRAQYQGGIRGWRGD